MIRWNGKNWIPAGIKPVIGRRRGAPVPGRPKARWVAGWVGGFAEPSDSTACDFTFSPIFPPSPTPTSTVTPTITPTASITPTPTITPTATVTPTPSPSVIPTDPDSDAYLAAVVAAGGTLDATISAATDTLFVDLKAAGLYSDMYFYPLIGGTAASQAIIGNRSQSAYDMTWNGGVVHDVSGATMNGTNAYGNTSLSRQDYSPAAGNASFGVYLNGNDTAVSRYDMGTSSVDDNVLITRYGNNSSYLRYDGPSGFITGTNNVSANGFYGASITGATGGTVKLLRNWDGTPTTIINGTSNDGMWNTLDLWVGQAWGQYSIRSFAFVFYTTYITDAKMLTLEGIINDFQTSLGRNTYS